MKLKSFRGASGLLAAMIAVLVAGSSANAQVTAISQARGQVYFSSDSNYAITGIVGGYNYAAPPPLVNPGTGSPAVNSFNALTGIPGAPAGGLANAFNVANSFSFLPPPGYTYLQSDPLPGNQKTTAGLRVTAAVHPLLLNFVSAPAITVGPFTGLDQGINAPGYALEQFDFDMFYKVGINGLLPAVVTPTANITGHLFNSANGAPPFAEFGEELNYYEVYGATTIPLGSAGSYMSWNTAGPVIGTVTGTPSLIHPLFVSTSGLVTYLEVTGTVFFEGDPSDLTATIGVPAPAPAAGTLALTGLAGAVLLFRRRAGRALELQRAWLPRRTR
jgi:hypothetical protein